MNFFKDTERQFWLGVSLAFAVALFLVAYTMKACTPGPGVRIDLPVASSPPAAVAAASASTQASSGSSSSFHVVIRTHRTRVATGSQEPTSQEAQEGASRDAQVLEDPTDETEIDISGSASSIASSSAVAVAEATASAPIPLVDHGDNSGDNHGRVGVAALSVPGVLAIDAEVLSVHLPALVLGARLEVGADVEANTQQAGTGISAGGKLFGTAGLWSTWNTSQHGWYAGVGLRF